MIGQITKILFGYDFFISYSHQDGKPYAESLERELARIDCVAFRDESEHGQGSLLEVWLKFSIRRSSAIIVVGTEGALASHHVKREVENATAWKKQLLPVDAMGIRTRACWPGFEEERIWIEDPSARVPCPAHPSPEVIGLLSAKLQHERKNRWTASVRTERSWKTSVSCQKVTRGSSRVTEPFGPSKRTRIRRWLGGRRTAVYTGSGN